MRVAITLLLLSTTAHAEDNPPFLNGMPCVAEVCIGDDARTLGDIPWVAAVNPANDVPLARSSVSDEALSRLSDVLEGDDAAVRTLAPYWYLHRLDKGALAALGEIRAVCANVSISERMTGTYQSKQGLLTEVSVEPVPTETGLRFEVASIVQYLEAPLGDGRLKALAGELNARYSGLPHFPGPNKPGGGLILHSPRGPHLKLLAPFGESLERARRFSDRSECNGHDLEADTPLNPGARSSSASPARE
ncbi:MAG: hypothetical protein ABI433_18380 [Burkholderiaceae bacterium]